MNQKKIYELKYYQNALIFSQFRSADSLGRRHALEAEDADAKYFGAIDPFFVDKEKIRLSGALERLNNVSQFSLHYHGPLPVHLFRHTSEVVAIATIISKILGLNSYLTEAIAMLHDVGHPFYGHLGEKIITKYSGASFRHETMSVIVAQKIERSGKGLNLSWETLEGAQYHSRANRSLLHDFRKPAEYGVVVLADKLASMISDPEAALYYKYFKDGDLPKEFFQLGKNHSERIYNCIFSLVKESAEKGLISFFDSEVAQKFEKLRQWNYENLYFRMNNERPRQKLEEDFNGAYPVLYNFFEEIGCDIFLALALMTDKELLKIIKIANTNREAVFKKNFFRQFPVFNLLFSLPENERISLVNADLDKGKFHRYGYFA